MLSDKAIIEQMKQGNIVIEPFREDFLGTNSYDCTLGPWHYQSNPMMNEVFLDDPSDIAAYWQGPFEPIWSNSRQQDYIPILPGTTILAHTQERIGTHNGIVAKMFSKSTTVRYGLSVCKCGGLGDSGYDNIWVMEISNHSNVKLYLPVGFKICQFTFYNIGETLKEYKGNYGQDAIFKPEHMLPKAARIPC